MTFIYHVCICRSLVLGTAKFSPSTFFFWHCSDLAFDVIQYFDCEINNIESSPRVSNVAAMFVGLRALVTTCRHTSNSLSCPFAQITQCKQESQGKFEERSRQHWQAFGSQGDGRRIRQYGEHSCSATRHEDACGSGCCGWA